MTSRMKFHFLSRALSNKESTGGGSSRFSNGADERNEMESCEFINAARLSNNEREGEEVELVTMQMMATFDSILMGTLLIFFRGGVARCLSMLRVNSNSIDNVTRRINCSTSQ